MTIVDKDFRHTAKTQFISAIFLKERIRLKECIDAIQDRHALLHNAGRAFLLDGAPIWNGDAAAARVKKKIPLHADDQEEARRLVKLQTKLNMDEQRMTNFFSAISLRCYTAQDFRDAIPDIVVGYMTMPEITGLSRTRKEGYIFNSSPTKMKLFKDGVKISYHYLANRLVFD